MYITVVYHSLNDEQNYEVHKALGGRGVPGRPGRIFKLGGQGGSEVGEEVRECGKVREDFLKISVSLRESLCTLW